MTPRRLEIAQMPGMEQVEHAVGEDNGLASAARVGHKGREFVDAEDRHVYLKRTFDENVQ